MTEQPKGPVYFGLLLSTAAQVYTGGTVEWTVLKAKDLIDECARVSGLNLADLEIEEEDEIH